MRAQFAVAVVLACIVAPASAQHRPGIDTVPALGAGERVRVWVWEYGPHARPYAVLIDQHEVQVTGELVTYDPPDSVIVRRTGLLGPLAFTRAPTISWDRISRIDRPNGHNHVMGAAYGFASAFTVSLLISAGQHAEGACGHPGERCQSMWLRTARYSLVAVPVGAVVGYFFTRWKRIY